MRKNFIVFLLTFLFFFYSLSLFGQNSGNEKVEKITLDDAIRKAFIISKVFKEKMANLSIDKNNRAYFWLRNLPNVELKISNPGRYEQKNFGSSYEFSSSLNTALSISLPKMGPTILNDYIDKLIDLKFSTNDVAKFEKDFKISITDKYYKIILEERKYKEQESFLVQKTRDYELTSRRYNRGLAQKVDFIGAKIGLNTAKLELSKDKRRINFLKDEFKIYLGFEDDVEIVLSDDFSTYINKFSKFDYNADKILEFDKDLRKLNIDIKRRENQLNKSYLNFFPKIEGQFKINYPFSSYKIAPFPASHTYANPSLVMGLTISINLMDYMPFSENYANIAKNKFALAVLKETYQYAYLKRMHEIDNILTSISFTKDEIEMLNESKDLLKEKITILERNYAEGKISHTNYQNEQESYFKLIINILDKQYNLVTYYQSLM